MSIFEQEVAQRRMLSRQAKYRKCGSKSKKCPMSTDHMTKRQWEERCGDIVTYQLGKPMSWDEFKQMPSNIQKEYLLNLIHKYSTTAADLSRMFGITAPTVTKFCGNREIGIEFSRGKRMSKDCRAEFEKFLSSGDGFALPATPGSEAPPAVPDVRTVRSEASMEMTEFSLCFHGIISPEMVANSIVAMLRPDAAVKLEVRCSILP